MAGGAQAFGIGFEAGRSKYAGLGRGISTAGTAIVEAVRRKKEKEYDLKKLLMEFEQRDKEQGKELAFKEKEADRDWELNLREALRKEKMDEVQINRIIEDTKATKQQTEQSAELFPLAKEQTSAGIESTKARTRSEMGAESRASTVFNEQTGAGVRGAGNEAAVASYKEQIARAGLNADFVKAQQESWHVADPETKKRMAEGEAKKKEGPAEMTRSVWIEKMTGGKDAVYDTPEEASDAYDRLILKSQDKMEMEVGLPMGSGTVVNEPKSPAPKIAPKLATPPKTAPSTAEQFVRLKFKDETLWKLDIPIAAAHYGITEDEMRKLIEKVSGGSNPPGKRRK